jgi:gliding motility-associated-like protein
VTTAGSYTVTVTQNGCSAASDAVVVSVQACATNQPPAIAPTPLSTVVEGKVTLSLINLISDPDNNLDLSTLRIVSPPTSGAQASIVNGELILDYKGIPFLGTDELTIEVCDLAGACTQQKLLVDVIGDVVVYNAISPNGDGKNDKWIIQYIDILADYRANEVTLYNRWGDVVWSGTNYNNSTVVFTGQGNNGNELPTGTYFYKIEFATAPARTGYLSLRR